MKKRITAFLVIIALVLGNSYSVFAVDEPTKEEDANENMSSSHELTYEANNDGTHKVSCSAEGCTEHNSDSEECDVNDELICNLCKAEYEMPEAMLLSEEENHFNYINYSYGDVEGIVISSFSGGTTDKEIVIPNKIDGKNVIGIFKEAFYSEQYIESVVIPEGVLEVGQEAFYNCGSLKSVKIPNSCKTIGQDAFGQCRNLDTVQWGGVETFGKKSFQNCKIEEVVLPNSAKTLQDYSFNMQALKKITIPSSVTSIGDYTFDVCENLTICGDVGTYAETYANSKGYTFVANDNAGSEVDSGQCGDNLNWALSSDGTLIISGTGNMDDYVPANLAPWEQYKDDITKLKIEEGVTGIGNYAFYFHKNIAGTLELPSTIKSIGIEAFDNCWGITGKITIPEGTESVMVGSFAGCRNIEEISYPSTLTLLGNGPLNACYSLKKVINLSNNNLTLPNIEGKVWTKQGVPGYEIVAISNGTAILVDSIEDEKEDIEGTCGDDLNWKLTSDGRLIISGTGAMYDYRIPGVLSPWHDYCSSITDVELPEGLTHIGSWAFYDCRNWNTELNIPSTVKSIGTAAFYDCRAIKGALNLPSDLKRIEDRTFYGCESLTSIGSWPSNLNSIMHDAFIYCKGLEGDIKVPSTVLYIDELAFFCCSNIESIEFPNSVSYIGSRVIDNCSKLTKIVNKSNCEVATPGNYSPNEDYRWYLGDNISDETSSVKNNTAYKGTYVKFYNTSPATLTRFKRGDVVVAPEVDLKPGHELSGWYTSSGFAEDTKWDFSTTLNDAVSLYPKQVPKKYTLSFDYQGGTGDVTSTEIQYNNAYGTLPEAIREGYTFAGWYNDPSSGTKVSSSDKFLNEDNCTLYAHWSANNYTVTLNANGGNCSTSSILVSFNDAYGSLPTPSKVGANFKGWFTLAEGGTLISSTTKYEVAGDSVLYAQWDLCDYVVTLNPNGGVCDLSSKTLHYGDQYGTLPSPSRAGYTFGGWYDSATGGNIITEMSVFNKSSDETIYAHWVAVTYSITYNLDGGTNNSSNISEYTPESNTFYLQDPSKTGHTFVGWTGANGTTPEKNVSIVKGTVGDKEYTANWQPNTYKITLHYDTRGGVGVLPDIEKDVTYPSTSSSFTISSVEPSRDGFIFDGWYTEETAGTKIGSTYSAGDNNTAGNQTIVIYAHWNAITYHIEYVLNGGINADNPTTYNADMDIVLNPATKEGYVFDGWYDGDKKVTKIVKGTTGDISLEAKWKNPPKPESGESSSDNNSGDTDNSGNSGNTGNSSGGTTSTEDKQQETIPTYVAPEKKTLVEIERKNIDGTTTNLDIHVDGTVRETTPVSTATSAELSKLPINIAAPTVISDAKVIVDRGDALSAFEVEKVTLSVDVKTLGGNINITPEMVDVLKKEAVSKVGKKDAKTIDIKVNTTAANGNPVSFVVSSDDLKNNSLLYAYIIDPVTGGYIMTEVPAIKYDNKTGLMVNGLLGGFNYKLVSAKEAKEIEQSILDSIRLTQTNSKFIYVSAGSVVDLVGLLEPGVNVANINRVEYSAGGNKGVINQATGQLFINEGSKGTINVSIKVTLNNGLTKTVKAKLKVE